MSSAVLEVERDRQLLQMATQVPVTALVIGRAGARIRAGLESAYPGATVKVIEEPADAADFSGTGYAAGTLDLLVLANALEELYDPEGALKNARSILSSRAQVLAAIPNVRNLRHVAQLLGGRWDYAEGGTTDARSIRFFTLKSVLEIFGKSGYAVEAIQPHHDPQVSGLASVPGGTVNIQVGTSTIKALNEQDIVEFRTLEYLVRAKPQ